MRQPVRWIGLAAALVVLAGISACGGESAQTDEAPPATASAAATTDGTTPARAAATATETPGQAASTATAASEPVPGTPFGVASLNGLRCEGEWQNLTFGSTGGFNASFSVNEAGDAGTVVLEIGGNAFGASGGQMEAPFTHRDGRTTLEADLGFLGAARMTFEGGEPVAAVLEAPPALGSSARVSLTEFEFDAERLLARVEIDFGSGAPAESRLDADCS